MQSKLVVSVIMAAACSAHAAVVVPYAAPVTAGVGNHASINMGKEFSVTGSGIIVRDLGIYDYQSDGLLSAHTVSLFSIQGATGINPTVTLIASVEIAAGTGATLQDSFRYASLAAPQTLVAGNYAVVAYGFYNAGSTGGTGGTGDPYSNGGTVNSSANFTNIAFTPFQFTANASSNFPNGGDASIRTSANFRYDVIPEPSGLALISVAGMGLMFRRNRRG